MKKKHILWMSVCLAVFAGCSGETYVGELPDSDMDDLGEPIPIVLGLGVPSYDILTRGNGPFENTLDEDTKALWENAQFYVYAFNKNPETDLRKTWSEGNEDFCLLDGYRTLKDRNPGGKETRVNIDNTSLMPFWPDENELKVYYNTKHVDWPYHFFAYYLDDTPVRFERSGDGQPATFYRDKDRIAFDVEVDGRRDFMSAMAEPTDEQIKKLEGTPNKDKILSRAFSAYSANRGLNPVFRFKHHLVRLKFEIYPGGKVTAENIEMSKRLVVQGIKVDTKKSGLFTVAVSDPLSVNATKPKLGLVFGDEAERGWCSLGEKNPSEDLFKTSLVQDKYYAEMTAEDDGKSVYERTAVPVGESLLIAPDSRYNLLIHLVQYNKAVDEDGKTVEKVDDVEYELLPPTTHKLFEAGKNYTIRIAIYNLSKIEIDYVPSEWGEGGGVTWEPDDEDW